VACCSGFEACVQVPDEMARYKQLLFLASKLPPLAQQDRTDDNKVKGCVSQVSSAHAPLALPMYVPPSS